MENKFIVKIPMKNYYYFDKNGNGYIYSSEILKLRSHENTFYGIKLIKNENNRTTTPRFRLL